MSEMIPGRIRDPNEYQRLALRTAAAIDDRATLRAVCALGLCGEATELKMAECTGDKDLIRKECGDVLWYVAVMADSYGLTIENLDREYNRASNNPNGGGIQDQAGLLADVIKKEVGHGHNVNTEAVALRLGLILDSLVDVANRTGWTISMVAHANIEKLKKRYPEGFSTEASQNRTE